MKYVLLTFMTLIAALHAATQCICEIGLYLRDVDGKCAAEIKHFDTPAIAEGCNPLFTNLPFAVDVDACTQKGLNVTFYRDQKCTKQVGEEDYLHTGVCHDIKVENHTVALMTTCGEQ
eukprot:230003_1